jgi:hypothetical protein
MTNLNAMLATALVPPDRVGSPGGNLRQDGFDCVVPIGIFALGHITKQRPPNS